jgi:hypothetical protein
MSYSADPESSIMVSYNSYINIFRNGKNPHYTENIYSCGLNVLLDRSGHSTAEIICFFIMSGLKYHNLYMCIKAQTCLCCKLLQNAAIFFLYFVSLFSDLMASGNPFQTVAMAARRVPDDFCGSLSCLSSAARSTDLLLMATLAPQSPCRYGF